MERHSSLNYIANSFFAADKIRNVYNSSIQENNRDSAREFNFPIILEVLKIIGDYSPGKNKEIIYSAVDMSSLYNNTYRNLKEHIQCSRSRNINLNDLTKTLEVRPIFRDRNRVAIDKLLKIYQIIIS